MIDNLNFFSTFPVTAVLMLVMAIAGIGGIRNRKIFYRYILHPYGIVKQKEFDRLFTADFFHNDFLHLAINEILLYIFGSDLEEFLHKLSKHGSWFFLLIYLGSMLFAAGAATLRHFKDFEYSTCGASGSIMGCMFGFMLLAPDNESLYLPVFGDIKNIYSGLLYILVMIIYRNRSHNKLVNHEVHFFGALGGMLVTLCLFPHLILK